MLKPGAAFAFDVAPALGGLSKSCPLGPLLTNAFAFAFGVAGGGAEDENAAACDVRAKSVPILSCIGKTGPTLSSIANDGLLSCGGM